MEGVLKKGYVEILKKTWVWIVALTSNSPKLMQLLVKNCIQKTKGNISDWPSQHLDLTPMEKLGGELKTKDHQTWTNFLCFTALGEFFFS